MTSHSSSPPPPPLPPLPHRLLQILLPILFPLLISSHSKLSFLLLIPFPYSPISPSSSPSNAPLPPQHTPPLPPTLLVLPLHILLLLFYLLIPPHAPLPPQHPPSFPPTLHLLPPFSSFYHSPHPHLMFEDIHSD